jgi:hypothetical protein
MSAVRLDQLERREWTIVDSAAEFSPNEKKSIRQRNESESAVFNCRAAILVRELQPARVKLDRRNLGDHSMRWGWEVSSLKCARLRVVQTRCVLEKLGIFR